MVPMVTRSLATRRGCEGAGVMGRTETSDISSVDPSHSPTDSLKYNEGSSLLLGVGVAGRLP